MADTDIGVSQTNCMLMALILTIRLSKSSWGKWA